MQQNYSKKIEPIQKASKNTASSVLDASSQSEALQRKADMANNAAQREEAPRPNNTGMPDNLKTGIESLSGFSMDDVRVHYNSSKPATVQALAYTQGTDIHVAPGQEKHLPHEAWHVAQQMAGRVSPTTNINGMPVNDNAGLEHEADVMGEKAVQCKRDNGNINPIQRKNKIHNNTIQMIKVLANIEGQSQEYNLQTYSDLYKLLNESKPKYISFGSDERIFTFDNIKYQFYLYFTERECSDSTEIMNELNETNPRVDISTSETLEDILKVMYIDLKTKEAFEEKPEYLENRKDMAMILHGTSSVYVHLSRNIKAKRPSEDFFYETHSSVDLPSETTFLRGLEDERREHYNVHITLDGKFIEIMEQCKNIKNINDAYEIGEFIKKVFHRKGKGEHKNRHYHFDKDNQKNELVEDINKRIEETCSVIDGCKYLEYKEKEYIKAFVYKISESTKRQAETLKTYGPDNYGIVFYNES